MKIEFYNNSGAKIRVELCEEDNYWDAAMWGHERLKTMVIEGAADFQIIEEDDHLGVVA